MKVTYANAIGDALKEEMRRDGKVLIYGEDIAQFGNIFGITRGMLEEFGPKRVRNTPITETAIIGSAIGAAETGLRPCVELMYSDFTMVAFSEIFHCVSKWRYMHGPEYKLPLVIRSASGSSNGAGSEHSNTVESLFMHAPGLTIITPSCAYDAKGLLKSAIRDNDPVLFLEETAAYRMKEEVPLDPDFLIPLGKSKVVSEGEDLTVVTFGTSALKATKALPILEEAGVHIQLIDLRSLRPLDLDPVIESAKRTGKVLVVDEYTETYGISGEIAFQVTEQCYKDLKMPVQRMTLPETIIPAGPVMEDWVMLSPQKIADRIIGIVKG